MTTKKEDNKDTTESKKEEDLTDLLLKKDQERRKTLNSKGGNAQNGNGKGWTARDELPAEGRLRFVDMSKHGIRNKP